METVVIKFSNGAEIEVERNASTYIAKSKPEFPENLTDISIKGENFEENVAFGRIIECASIDGRYWFGIQGISEAERQAAQVRADIDYIAMETGVKL